MTDPTSHSDATRRRVLLLGALALALAGCRKKPDQSSQIQTAPVQRQDIVIDVEATGVVQPINPVEVRSKASGQIVKMPVSTGSQVKPGDLLVQIDPRDAQNRYDQAVAALKAAQANVQVTQAQYQRNRQLQQQGVITAPELEQTQLAYANAQSQLATARTNLELARIALEDVTIRAPIAGTVIEKNVSLGQVISSATNSVSGGTVLLSLANLSTIMDSTLVSESDIGNVRAGQQATVKVDAYPNRTFHGVVEKISPMATVQQSVTMFPVLVRLDNQDRALMPGMNSDVSVLVAQESNVLAVPNDAVRSPRDAPAAALALGLDPDQVRQSLQSQFGGRGGRGGAGGVQPGQFSDTATTAGMVPPRGDSAAPAATPAQCDSLRAAMAKHPAASARLQAIRQQIQSGALDFAAARTQMRAVYDSLHVDPRLARACARGNGENGGAALAANGGEGGAVPGTTRPHPGVVFVRTATKAGATFSPKVIMLGLGNYDVTQVLSGLSEGDQVALISAAAMQQARQEFQQRIQRRVGIPGMQQQQQGGRSGGGGRRGGT